MDSASPSYKGHRYPVEVIAHCVRLYHRFPLSFREVEELMLERGVVVSHETVRRWCAKFGQAYANGLSRRRPRPGDKWHLDEVFVRHCHVGWPGGMIFGLIMVEGVVRGQYAAAVQG
ncbi:transposase, partial [Streptomyces sp. NPDC098085]|uniref:transposase n=1 Tax=Streptomyces sp. NPDC098085 TaxID=3366094 RepID=UPI0038004107